MSFPPYPQYKDSGVEWLGAVPEHWETMRLRHLSECNPSKQEVSDHPDDLAVSFLPMEAIGDDGTIDLSMERELAGVRNGYTYFREGDVTLAKITPCFENGKGAIMRDLRNEVGFGTTELTVLRPDGTKLDTEFLFWLTLSPSFRLLGEGEMYGAGGQKRIPDSFVREFRCAFPPLAEQRGIALFLDRETLKLDGLVSEQRRLIGLLKEKRQAVISHAVTQGLNPNAPTKPTNIPWLGNIPEHWGFTRCGHYIQVLSGFAFPSSGFLSDDDAGAIRLLRGTNVSVGTTRWDDVAYWTREENDGLDDYMLAAGDMVIGMDRPWISSGVRVTRLTNSDTPCLLLQRVASIKTRHGLNADYLFQLLSSEMFVAYFEPVTTGVSVPHISPGQIADYTIPLPPESEQKQIVEHVESVRKECDEIMAVAESTIALLQERRSALISAAVMGKIDVRPRK